MEADERIEPTRHEVFDKLAQTVSILRAPNGCPWDREQTHESIASDLVGEAYEAVAAIEDGDSAHLREELGDVLLQVLMQSQIASDAGEFTIDDVIADVDAKMVRRHPHVFGEEEACRAAGLDVAAMKTGNDVLPVWDQIKLQEKRKKNQARAQRRRQAGLDPEAPEGLLDDVPRTQPALMQAQEISRKTARLGFEWDTTQDVWEKVDEEVREFRDAQPQSSDAELEMGDVLFCVVNVARKEGIDAETALRRTCAKFRSRWSFMEDEARKGGTDITDTGKAGLERLWQNAKAHEKD